MSSTATYSIPHAYRRLLRSGLRAIQYSTPARYTMTTLLRREFRPLTSPTLSYEERHSRASVTSLSKDSIDNLVAFLERCAREKGIEHSVVRNLGHVQYWRHINTIKGPARVKTGLEKEYDEVYEALKEDLMGNRVKVDMDMDITMEERDERFRHNPPIR